MSTERKQIMEIYRITYRQEVFIKADSEEQASLYFENIDINNLSKEIENENIVSTDFVEINEISKA